MSDSSEFTQKTPLSSSSSAPSGTQALSVTIEPHEDETMAQTNQPNSSGLGPSATDAQQAPAADNENQRTIEGADYDARELAGAFENDEQNSAAAPVEAERLVQSSHDQPAASFAAAEPLAIESDIPPELETNVRQTLAQNVAETERTFVLFEQMSKNFRAAFENAGNDAARISFKLMEFAQDNFQNNLKLAKDYADIKSAPEIFNAHATYFKRQMDLLNKQAEELRALTTDIASKKAAQLQSRITAG